MYRAMTASLVVILTSSVAQAHLFLPLSSEGIDAQAKIGALHILD